MDPQGNYWAGGQFLDDLQAPETSQNSGPERSLPEQSLPEAPELQGRPVGLNSSSTSHGAGPPPDEHQAQDSDLPEHRPAGRDP